MRTHVTVAAALHLAFSAIGLLAALLAFLAIAAGGALSGEIAAFGISMGVATLIAGFLALVSLPGLIGALGVLAGREWGRIVLLVVAFLQLINIPFGTALGIYTIWALLHRETVARFRRTPLATA